MSTQHNVSQRRPIGADVPSQPYASNGIDIDESKARRRRNCFASEKQRAAASVAFMALVSLLLFFRRGGPTTQNVRQLRDTSSLPLSKYSELSYALEHSDLVALYFAASWCGMSTPISHALDQAFGDNYNDYITGRNWIAVPFESDQRTQLKHHFRTCAMPEVRELGIDREREIPTIIVIDSASHDVLTDEGVKDIRFLKEGVLDHWIELQQKATGL
ncbi:hypothetical protein ACHAWO_002351 [Cyclotella atomus]|uniref:Thioredoxin domain-containing protein n=1 Tax=Cyclotella atomus TaxID=382360 RepID=A0ABD3PYE8_9STRA